MKRFMKNCGLAVVAVVTSYTAVAVAQEITSADTTSTRPPAGTTKVMEKWVALIRNPDSALCSPQIVNAMSPDGSTEQSYGLFEINHASAPTFLPGGFQVQAWHHDTMVGQRNSVKTHVLSRQNDRLEYTTVMSIKDGHIRYQLQDGRSRTWGKFAQEGDLYAGAQTDLTELSSYDPQYSVDNSSPTVGAHRVELLVLDEIVYLDAEDKVLKVDSTDRVPHRYQATIQEMTFDEYLALLADQYTFEIVTDN